MSCDNQSKVLENGFVAKRGATALVELKPGWRPSEDEIVLAAITVIFVALVAIIAQRRS
jgi:hypothetical protein